MPSGDTGQHKLERLPLKRERMCVVCSHKKQGTDQDFGALLAIVVSTESAITYFNTIGGRKREEEKGRLLPAQPLTETSISSQV